ncbi:UNVERIFIED_CONTAM: putative disease resistance protein [Sesamum radiatum]|uniref:Disease resistance protein n=1 Tax=Sesamum radiatum TaxID=300843 RepID=A0AAW2UAG7_SESRA
MNRVLMQGIYLPKKLNQWAKEARALKCQVSDLLQQQQNRKGNPPILEDLIEVGVKMINHLKKCPSKDEYMYDKPTPVIILTRESGLDKSGTMSELKYKTEQKFYSYSEGKKMELTQGKKEQSVHPSKGQDVLQDQDAGMIFSSAEKGLLAVELKERNDSITVVEKLGSELMSTSESIEGGEILMEVSRGVDDQVICANHPDSTSVSVSKAPSEFTEEGVNLRDKETKMSSTVSGFDSQQESSSSSMVIQAVHEMTLEGAENLSAEQIKAVSSSSKAGRSKENIPSPISNNNNENTSEFISEMKSKMLHPSSSQEILKEDYSIIVEGCHIKLKLDEQTILIEEHPSSGPLERSQVTTRVRNLVEQDLRELPEKLDYSNSLLLFLQRNRNLTLVHSSFFNSMPDLRFLDLSDTRIRTLPSSLFTLSKLKVIMLRNCVSLDKLPTEIENLNHLEVLDLSGTELYCLPDEIGQLTGLKHLQLSFYGPDDESEYAHLPSKLISPGVLSHLKALQALGIIVHPEDQRWRKSAAHIMNDIARLEMLSYLQFYFPEVEIFQDFIGTSPSWKGHILRKFKFIVGHNVKRIVSRVPDEVESAFDQGGQCLRFVNGDRVPQMIEDVLMHVRAFYLDHHSNVQSLSEFGISNFKALQLCVLRECPNLKMILDDKATEGEFPSLEHLGVYYLWELVCIWKLPSPPQSLQALKYLTVSTCPKLHFILWESMLQCLSNLEELVVEDCESVKIIIKEEKKTTNYDATVLPRLRKVVLRYLPELVSLGNGLCISEENISSYGCPKLGLNSQPKEKPRAKHRKFLSALRFRRY